MSNDNFMSQEEIEKMLMESGQLDDANVSENNSEQDTSNNDNTVEENQVEKNTEALNVNDYLSKEEQDVLGEIGNICMGTSATTIYTLLNHRVNITTPRISIHTPKSLEKEYLAPMVIVDVNYTEGVTGKNVLILKEYDVALMTDVLMGSDGSSVDKDNIILDEMHLSAIREVMNQMVGSSATSLSQILNRSIDISPPTARHITIDETIIEQMFDKEKILVRICFDMKIEGLLNSQIMQVLDIDFAKNLVKGLIENQEAAPEETAPTTQKQEVKENPPAQNLEPEKREENSSPTVQNNNLMNNQSAKMMEQASFGTVRGADSTNYQSVEYPSFDNNNNNNIIIPENIGILANVPMNVSVRLGKTKKKIKEILDFTNGSVIVLDKLAGEPVDILVNGKHIAKGEVVVVDDNYGVRITEIDSNAIGESI